MKFLIPLLLGATLATAQQTPQYSLYMLNPYSLNPAAAGLENDLVIIGQYRQQWAGLQGAPVSQHLNVSMPVNIISSGVGIRMDNETIGAHGITQAMFSCNYQLEIGNSTTVSLGVGAGFLQYTLDGAKLRAPQGTYVEPDGILIHNDQFLPENKVRAGVPVFEAGVQLVANRLELGVAAMPVYASALQFNTAGGASIQPVQHYLASAAYNIGISRTIQLKPALLIKTDSRETQAEISILTKWRDNIFAGTSFRGFGARAKDAAVIIAGMKINEKTTLAYAFDIPLSPLNTVSRGSHELLLRYALNKPIGAGKLPPVIYNPRFF